MQGSTIRRAAIAALVFGATPALGQWGYWDLFSVSMLDNYYWNLTAKDAPNLPGTVKDQDPLPPLGGVMDWWGGEDWWYEDLPLPAPPPQWTRSLERRTSGGSVLGTQRYLNVILDTATFCDADILFPSWGTVEQLTVTQFGPDGQRVLVPGQDFTWERSPIDPDSTLQIDPMTSSTSIALAPNDFNDNNTNFFALNGPMETQTKTIWGFAAVLPAGFLYQVDYDVDWWTWDSYVGPCYTPQLRFIPAPGTLALGALALAFVPRRRR